MDHWYKAQELVVPNVGEKYWCDIGPVYNTQEDAQTRIDHAKEWEQNMKIGAYRIISRPVGEWEEITREDVSNDDTI